MIFKTLNNYIVRVPDDRLSVSIGPDSECEAWETGTTEPFLISHSTAISILKQIGDKEAE